jgi:hypothetical protein
LARPTRAEEARLQQLRYYPPVPEPADPQPSLETNEPDASWVITLLVVIVLTGAGIGYFVLFR